MSSPRLRYRAIHPFPARMAPEIVEDVLAGLRRESTVLDPMMGSGTFPLAAGRAGHRALGFDTDPLALLIAETGLCGWDTDMVLDSARAVLQVAYDSYSRQDWLHTDQETDQFIDFWFDAQSKQKLAALAAAIGDSDPKVHGPLWVAFSRLIITKDRGASRARDVSHSRPHRVRSAAAMDPLVEYFPALQIVLSRALGHGPPGAELVQLFRGDARALPVQTGSVDLVLTSPPYLTAIDYLRGHRLSLVWMGYTLAELRLLRASNIGSERSSHADAALAGGLSGDVLGRLKPRLQGVVQRYFKDLDLLLKEIARVLRSGGTATFVTADATLQGVSVDIAAMMRWVCELNGLSVRGVRVRDLPASSRYLPLPSKESQNSLARRMRSETILTVAKS